MNSEYVVAGRWNEALGLKALPPNVPKSLEALANLMDDMWHYAGDTSADVRLFHLLIFVQIMKHYMATLRAYFP